MGQILIAFVSAIKILYKNAKGIVRLSDFDIDFIGIVSEDLQGEILATYFCIVCLDYELQM